MPKISVVIPTYNRRVEVMEAVASVRAQTAEVFEILVIDDGSTDDTEKCFAELKPPVRYLRIANQGVSAARNHGVNAALGDWIAFLDSDDEWHSDKLAKQIACVEKTGSKVCFSGCENDAGGRLDDLELMDPSLGLGEYKSYPPTDYRLFRHPRHPYIQSLLVEKCALLRVGLFDESLRVAEDTKLVYRLVMSYGYSVVNQTLMTICRKGNRCGLSDNNEASAAAVRFECYTRVQAEFYWAMLVRDPQVARILRANHGYFVSRWAELAAVLGKFPLARSLGREGLISGGNLKSRIRSVLIWISPLLYGKFSRRKWGV